MALLASYGLGTARVVTASCPCAQKERGERLESMTGPAGCFGLMGRNYDARAYTSFLHRSFRHYAVQSNVGQADSGLLVDFGLGVIVDLGAYEELVLVPMVRMIILSVLSSGDARYP